jgi:site-specific recombinase XerD
MQSRPSGGKARQESVHERETPELAALSPSEAHDHLKRTLAGTKWKVIRGWHVFRHSFVSACASKGIDQRLIQSWCGHMSAEMSARYTHLYPSTQRTALDSVFD